MTLDLALCRGTKGVAYAPPLRMDDGCGYRVCRVLATWTMQRPKGEVRLCTKHAARTIRRDRRRGGGRRG